MDAHAQAEPPTDPHETQRIAQAWNRTGELLALDESNERRINAVAEGFADAEAQVAELCERAGIAPAPLAYVSATQGAFVRPLQRCIHIGDAAAMLGRDVREVILAHEVCHVARPWQLVASIIGPIIVIGPAAFIIDAQIAPQAGPLFALGVLVSVALSLAGSCAGKAVEELLVDRASMRLTGRPELWAFVNAHVGGAGFWHVASGNPPRWLRVALARRMQRRMGRPDLALNMTRR